MLNAIQAGILTSSTKERLEQLEETKRELEARIAEEKLAKPKIKEEFIRFWLMRLSGPSRIKGKWFGFGLLYCTTRKTAFDSCLFCFTRQFPFSSNRG
ncbi:Uncharacterised protein [uncultured Clostridium sp.]|nr:Uncharacterised protein [uncultured Clostridium sp.]